MTFINTNLPLNSNNNINEIINNMFAHNNRSAEQKNIIPDIGAYNMDSGIMNGFSNFDMTMDKVADFRDLLSNTGDIFSKMRMQGEALLKLINNAHEGSYSKEELESMNQEASEILANMDLIRSGAEFNGVNPLENIIGLNIPDWQNVVQQFNGTGEVEGVENAITEMLADINFDCDISAEANGSTFNMKASANVKIGFTDDGALQISVDATLDYDLSGVMKNGIESNEALELVKNFLDLLGGKFDGINTASSMFDSLFGENSFLTGGIVPSEQSDSSSFKGQMVQQTTITLDNVNQMPNIAINML